MSASEQRKWQRRPAAESWQSTSAVRRTIRARAAVDQEIRGSKERNKIMKTALHSRARKDPARGPAEGAPDGERLSQRLHRLVLRSARGFVTGLVLTILCAMTIAGSAQPVPGGATHFAVGGGHLVAVCADGSLWAWGGNWAGQLGDGTSGYEADKLAPVRVGTDSDWVAVAAGSVHTVALKQDGSLWAWGGNEYGQLGDGTSGVFADKSSPVRVGTATDWVAVSAGSGHTVALKQDGSLWAWGSNWNGQLGDGPTVIQSAPIRVGTETWRAVAAGGSHTLGVKTDGTLWAWGLNWYGQLGDGTTGSKSTPVQVGTDSDWATVADAADHTLALKTDGTLWAWGWNPRGELGDGTYTTRRTPVQVLSENRWSAVAAGIWGWTMALKTDGTLWLWGTDFSPFWEGFDSSAQGSSTPVQVGAGEDWKTFAAGRDRLVAIKIDGSLWAWGDNRYGRLGDGTTETTAIPVRVGTGNDWAVVAVGGAHTVALKQDGSLWAWGLNRDGELGDGTTESRTAPVRIGIENTWVAVAAGDSRTFGVKTDGTLWGWGAGTQTPGRVGTDANWLTVAAGAHHRLALKTDGTLWAWGNNRDGQLGDGTYTTRTTPVQVGTRNDWWKIAAGSYNSYALRTDGTLWAWGSNGSGQLGDGTTAWKNTPTQVGSANDWMTAGLGRALKVEGSLWAWGWNNHGQLGDGTSENKSSPVRVGTANDWAVVESSGSHYTAALKTDGTLWIWGSNHYGTFGNGCFGGGRSWPEPVPLPAVGNAGFHAWCVRSFTPTQRADPGISGPLAAPAGDGIANLAKYAFGLDPHARATNADLVQARMSGGRLQLTYRARRDAADIDYLPEVSEDLVNWSAASVEELSRLPDDDEAFEVVIVQALLPDTAAKGFVRIRIIEK